MKKRPERLTEFVAVKFSPSDLKLVKRKAEEDHRTVPNLIRKIVLSDLTRSRGRS